MTWSFDAPGRLAAAGVDAETVERFERLAIDEESWGWVFSRDERSHNRRLPSPSEGFCASFCTKEAVLKAVRFPYDLTECELFYRPGETEHPVRLAPTFRTRHGVDHATAHVIRGETGELIVAAYLFAGAP